MHEASPPPQRESLYKPAADQVLKSTLLDFEGPYDKTFVDTPSVNIGIDPMHAGNHVLVAGKYTALKLASLVRGRDFGGAWDVIGVRLYSPTDAVCEVSLPRMAKNSQDKPVNLPAGQWVTVWLDAARPNDIGTSPSTTAAADDSLALCVSLKTEKAQVLIDDVVLAQSRDTVSESHLPRTGELWTVMRRGLNWRAMLDGRMLFEVPAAPFVAGGYALVEASPFRAVWTDSAGSTLSLDRTGRMIMNGTAVSNPRVVSVAKAYPENAAPARIEVVSDEGRVERSLTGDKDNDGFDESRGCYVVHAVSGRATVRLTRQSGPVKWPVLEVLDLPAGSVGVWVEGELIDWAVRCDDGRVIVELPIDLSTPVEIQVRVK